MTLKDILQLHPTPWKHGVFPGGVIHVFDAAGKEVPLLTIIAFVELVTPRLFAGTTSTPQPAVPQE